jgi:metallo-beta-lactamase family protein
MKITFWGAAGTVTGSMHQVDAGGRRYLLDCGMYQGRRKDANERNRNLPIDAASVDAVILSHAHIDHSGNLPSLVKNGYSGPIYATPASVDLCDAMLRDTAHILEKDAEFVNKRHHQNGPVEPIYTMADAEGDVLALLHAHLGGPEVRDLRPVQELEGQDPLRRVPPDHAGTTTRSSRRKLRWKISALRAS